MDLQGNVLEYAPKNTNGKEDFVYVSGPIQQKMFIQMLKAIEHDGEGLSEIVYPSGYSSTKRFLTSEELAHLQDVSGVISLLKSFWKLMLVMLLLAVGLMFYGSYPPLYLSTILWSISLLSGALYIVAKVFGLVNIFYGVHKLIFPAGHKWFFYYEESLMSTLLRAPDSFLVFGIILGFFTLVSFVIIYKAVLFSFSGAMSRFR